MKVRDVVGEYRQYSVNHDRAEMRAAAEHPGDIRLFALAGRELGRGAFRRVFAHKDDAAKVIKIELAVAREYGVPAHNRTEWEFWQLAKANPQLAPWFAPCHEISGTGFCLVQARTETVERLPAALPRLFYFWDLAHAPNWGLLDGRPVCRDYGSMRKVADDLAAVAASDWLAEPEHWRNVPATGYTTWRGALN